MKILGIACSPRSKSNTSILLEKAISFLKEKGNDTEIIYLRKLNFKLCIGCENCSKTGNCVFKDDLVDLFNKIENANKVIIAAPVYSMGLNALGKEMVDRAQMYWARKYILRQTNNINKQGMFISVSGLDLKGVHDCSIKTIKYFFKMLDIEYKKEFLVTKVDAPGEILSKPQEIARLNKVLETF